MTHCVAYACSELQAYARSAVSLCFAVQLQPVASFMDNLLSRGLAMTATSYQLQLSLKPVREASGIWYCGCSESGAKQWPEKEFLNPLKDPLPDAPNMSVYCMYGVGAPAERSYHYQHVEDTMVNLDTLIISACGFQCHLLLCYLGDLLLLPIAPLLRVCCFLLCSFLGVLLLFFIYAFAAFCI